jgi:gliding motility-associated-like protein
VTVRDEFGCDAIENIQVGEEPAPNIDDIDIIDATCSASNGSVFITPNIPDGAKYSLNNIDFQQNREFTDLAPGEYAIYLIDDNGCMDSSTISIAEIEQTNILDIQITDASCVGNDGEINILSDIINTDVQYSIDGSSFQLNSLFTDLQENAYTGYLIDENGCLDSMIVTIQGKESVVLNSIEITPASCEDSDGALHIQTKGTVEITLNNVDPYSSEFIEGLTAGIYSVTLTNESQCTLDTVIEISRANCNVYVPNAFSPNGDGTNETLSPFYDLSQYRLLQFQIFDRWGNNVFSCNQLCEWDGKQSGKTAPAGVYIYYLQIQDPDGEISNISGDVTLLQ